MTPRIPSLLLFAVLVLGYRHLSAQPSRADEAMARIMREYPVAGMSVAVVKGNKVVYSRSLGSKDLESGIPLSDSDIFRIASISKTFAATAVMQLCEKGRLSLEDDVSRLIGFTVRNPAYPDRPITLRMLLSHRSSINDSQGYFTLDAIDPSGNADWKKAYSAYEPGSAYRYCNLNYNMVGAIVERASGERYDLYVKRHILEPLRLYGGYRVDDLDSSRFARIYQYQTDSARFSHSTAAYDPRRAEFAAYVPGRSTPILSPTGGMKISAKDLAEYMLMHSRQGRHRGRRILSRESTAEMQRPYTGQEGYGLAIMTTRELISGHVMKGHTGSAYGLYSLMFFDPVKRFGIVAVSNGCHTGQSAGFNTVLHKTANALYESLLRK
jgi:CubicO group peptidase (beta-lactamase class C family)